MLNATRQVEITVRSGRDPATLSRLMATIGSCGTEVLAACSYWDGFDSVMMFVPEQEAIAIRALEAAGFKCMTHLIVLVETPDQPGLAAALGGKLTYVGIEVLYSYSSPRECDRAYVVFKTTNDFRAMYVLEADALIHDVAAAKNCREPIHAHSRELHPDQVAA